MTAVDRPDNGQDEAIREAMNVLGWSDWAQYEHLSPGHREDVDRVADYVREQAALATTRAGAGEQQRNIERVAAELRRHWSRNRMVERDGAVFSVCACGAEYPSTLTEHQAAAVLALLAGTQPTEAPGPYRNVDRDGEAG